MLEASVIQRNVITRHLWLMDAWYACYSDINPYSVGVDFRREIATSAIDPRTVNILAVDHNIGI